MTQLPSARTHPGASRSPTPALLARTMRNTLRWGVLLGLALAGFASAQAQGGLGREQAQALVTPFYRALVATDPADVRRALERLTAPRWRNCSDLEVCETRAQTLERWTERSAALQGARWVQRELLVAGDRIVVRGEFSGTPTAPFLGVAPNGRSFTINTVDIHEVRGGQIVRTYHLENFALAVEQLSAGR